MKAIVQDRYGSPDVLQLREVDTPVIGTEWPPAPSGSQ
jgi:NADPH:quinone reductase-like Zn-dependent oxidoreductase